MRRRLFSLMTILSLLMCAGISTLWVRSYWRADAYAWRVGGGMSAVRSERGALSYIRVASIDPDRYPFDPPGELAGYRASEPYMGPPAFVPEWQFAGFSQTGGTAFALQVEEWTVPQWFVLLATAVLPGVWVVRQARDTRRNRHGLCPACGYDLRASTERCPECGTAMKVRSRNVAIETAADRETSA